MENIANSDIFQNGSQIEDLLKAMNVGTGTGYGLAGQDTNGSALKTESLAPTVKILTNSDKNIVLWKQIPKQTAYSDIEQFNQLVDYGGRVGIFNQEGETPSFTDAVYRREAVKVKYMGLSGEVTHPFQLVNTAGIGDALANEVKNKTQMLLREINKQLSVADESKVSTEFNGLFVQHMLAVTGNSSLSSVISLDDYYNDSVVIDARGYILSDKMVESATNGIMQDNYGFASQIIAKPVVFSDYVSQFHESKRVVIGQNASVTGATMGQSVNAIQTQAGAININSDVFFDWNTPKMINATPTSTKAPDSPVKDGTTPIAAVTDTNNKFGSAYAASYYYAVAAKNRFGESALTLLNTSATPLAVAATEAVNLKFAAANTSAYAAESFVIYRTEAATGNQSLYKFYPLFIVSAAQLAAGYDGAGAGVVRDRNRIIANTTSAMIYDIDPEVFAYKELFPISRMDLAITSPSRKFMVLGYGTPVLYTGKKIARIVNIGKKVPA